MAADDMPERIGPVIRRKRMSKKPKPGGAVQISRKLYDVLEGPYFAGAVYRLMVRSQADGGGYWAESPRWRGGCGPWKIAGPIDWDAFQ